MHIGVIASSGGSVLKQVKEILDEQSHSQHQYYVIVDRPCALYSYCQENRIATKLIEDIDNTSFSEKAAKELLNHWHVEVVCLFYSRLVTHALFSRVLTVNFHPSLLPQYKGFNAIDNAIKDGYPSLGATLHVVDESVDGGPILACVSTPLTPLMREVPALAYTSSFIQKVYLMLLLISKLEDIHTHTGSNSIIELKRELDCCKTSSYRGLKEAYYNAIQRVQQHERLTVI